LVEAFAKHADAAANVSLAGDVVNNIFFGPYFALRDLTMNKNLLILLMFIPYLNPCELSCDDGAPLS